MRIPKSVFKASKITAKESTRYALAHVKVERGRYSSQCRVMATDARRLVIASWDDEKLGRDDLRRKTSTLVDREQWDQVGRCKPAGDKTFYLDEATVNGTVTIRQYPQEGTLEVESRTPEGKFPKVDQVIPGDPMPMDFTSCYRRYRADGKTALLAFRLAKAIDRPSHLVFTVDPKLLGELLVTMAQMAPTKERNHCDLQIGIDYPQNGGIPTTEQPIKLTMRNEDGINVTGVIMPMGR